MQLLSQSMAGRFLRHLLWIVDAIVIFHLLSLWDNLSVVHADGIEVSLRFATTGDLVLSVLSIAYVASGMWWFGKVFFVRPRYAAVDDIKPDQPQARSLRRRGSPAPS